MFEDSAAWIAQVLPLGTLTVAWCSCRVVPHIGAGGWGAPAGLRRVLCTAGVTASVTMAKGPTMLVAVFVGEVRRPSTTCLASSGRCVRAGGYGRWRAIDDGAGPRRRG